MTDVHHDKILILDFGSQYTQLIARRVREIGVYCEIYPADVDLTAIETFAPQGIILSGGPESAYGDNTLRAHESLLQGHYPILGICYGMQTLCQQLGGEVAPGTTREFGYAQTDIVRPDGRLLQGIAQSHLKVWMSHGDSVKTLPPQFEAIGASKDTPFVMVQHREKPLYGIQFHPEVTHTEQGKTLLHNFVVHICGCATAWTPNNIIEDSMAQIRQQAGQDHVILGLSGGVDSSVVAALLHRAIGDQLTCVFVDTGLLRWQEGDQVMQTFADHMGVKVIRINAAERYFTALAGIDDPEQKRKIIGNLFVDIFEEESKKIDNAHWLAQGTIYPDVIESAGNQHGKAHVIKSHHNVAGLPDYMKLSLLEPLRELFKDEVRKVGVALGFPAEMVYRHPFPGPGLGVRILAEVKAEYAHTLAQADHIFIELLRQYDWYDKVSQAFAVFLPVKSVGVVGDQRQYEHVIALRAVETIDFMTARWAQLPYELLDEAAHRIVNEVRGVSRVVYDISGKPPATIEWE